MEQGRGVAVAAHGDVVEGAETAADAVQEVAAVGGAGDAASAVAGSVPAAADLVAQGVVGSDSVVAARVVTASGGALDVGAEASDKQVVDVNEEAAGNKRKLDIAGFDDPSDSDDDEEYNSGDEVEEWNHKSFIEHEANKIREKGKAAYYKWGKFRCPYCTTKPIPKDGMYEHLMSHARGVATSGNDVKIRAEHAALLKAMGPI
ncbi:uncharacterized protein [Aegilops tauschii subsp. strangulata]|uniref:uncharacterized protein n=1 Tax=Aegilops tauschii subsp. strangulata TaxID=200361 RepID=UPI001E1C9EBB|nr:uncharacterized protein LOC123494913 [Aegilops tauschii subsp. strangulata]